MFSGAGLFPAQSLPAVERPEMSAFPESGYESGASTYACRRYALEADSESDSLSGLAKTARLPAGGVMTPGSCFDVSRMSSDPGIRAARHHSLRLCAGPYARAEVSPRAHCLRRAQRKKALRSQLRLDAEKRQRRFGKPVRCLSVILSVYVIAPLHCADLRAARQHVAKPARSHFLACNIACACTRYVSGRERRY